MEWKLRVSETGQYSSIQRRLYSVFYFHLHHSLAPMYTAAPIVAQHYPPFSLFSVESFHFINHNSPPSHFRPTFERRIAPVCGARSGLPAGSLITSTTPTLTENEERTFSKGDKTRKIAHLHPLEPVASGWTWIQRVKRGRPPHQPERSPNTKQCRSMPQAQLTDERQRAGGRRTESVCGGACKWFGRGKDVPPPNPNLAGVTWCMEQCIELYLNQDKC